MEDENENEWMDSDELVMKKTIMQHHPWQMYNNSDYYYYFYEIQLVKSMIIVNTNSTY